MSRLPGGQPAGTVPGMRIAALDVGQARIGVAVSDELGITAQGIGVVKRVGGRRADPPGIPGRPPSVTLGGLWRGLAALAGAGSLGAVALAVALSRPGPPVQAPVAITVEEGERFAEVAADLARQGVLRHPLPLILWGRLTRQDRNVH